eukprot:COSAG01_NODE_3314_length_6276_cov_280.140845_2_plen_340_part_00
MAAVLGHRAPYPLAGRAHEQGVFAASLEEVITPNQLARRTQGPVLTGTGTASGTVLRSSQQGASVPLQLRGKRGFSFLEGEEAEAIRYKNLKMFTEERVKAMTKGNATFAYFRGTIHFNERVAPELHRPSFKIKKFGQALTAAKRKAAVVNADVLGLGSTPEGEISRQMRCRYFILMFGGKNTVLALLQYVFRKSPAAGFSHRAGHAASRPPDSIAQPRAACRHCTASCSLQPAGLCIARGKGYGGHSRATRICLLLECLLCSSQCPVYLVLRLWPKSYREMCIINTSMVPTTPQQMLPLSRGQSRVLHSGRPHSRCSILAPRECCQVSADCRSLCTPR